MFGTVSLASTTVLVCRSVCCAQRRNWRKGRSQRLCFAGRCVLVRSFAGKVSTKFTRFLHCCVQESAYSITDYHCNAFAVELATRRKNSVFNLLLLLLVQLLRRWIQFQFNFFLHLVFLVNFIVSFATGTFVASNCRCIRWNYFFSCFFFLQLLCS